MNYIVIPSLGSDQTERDSLARESATSARLDVWWIDLTRVPFDPDVLSADERARAGRRIPERSRFEFVAARSSLRHILARYCEDDPRTLRIAVGPLGKPHLPEHPGRAFSLSHSERFAVCAVGQDTDLGVDCEAVRPLSLSEGLVARVCTGAEQRLLEALEGRDQLEAFFQMWTLKEAFAKAAGLGLQLPFERIETAHGLSQPIACEAYAYSLSELEAPGGYKAALAIAGGHPRLEIRRDVWDGRT